MPEDADDSPENEISVFVVYFFGGLLVPFFFDTFTQAQNVGVYFIMLGVFAACILYGEFSVSIPTGFALALGILLASFGGQDWALFALAIAAVTVNLLKNGLSERNASVAEDLVFGPPA